MSEQKKRILVVDDDKTNINLLGSVLAERYDVSIALNGEQALKLASSDLPLDLVLLDLKMPGISGVEVAHEIRSGDGPLAKSAAVPIVAMTASIIENEDQACREVGMNALMLKPIAPDDLFETVEQWLQARPAANTDGFVVSSASSRRETGSDTGLISFGHLGDMVGLEEEIIQTTLNQFIKSVNEDIAGLGSDKAKSDSEEVRFHAHRIKGAANLIGAFAAGDLAFDIEKRAANDEILGDDALIAQLVRVIEELVEYIGGLDLKSELAKVEE